MDRFIKIDPTTRLKKTVIAERDGALIEFYPNFLASYEASDLYKELRDLKDWKIGETMTAGGLRMTSRLIIGLVHPDTKESENIFTPLLLRAHEKIKELTGETFNYAYLNFYRDGNDHIGWHSDKEETLEEGSTIASLSLGATRDFMIRHISDTKLAQNMSDDNLRIEALESAKQTIPLKSGSLLLMKKLTQKVYHHHIPKRLNVKSPRINITFRHIKDLE
jgi:alkylated DNA repair dioxygenase AlkB